MTSARRTEVFRYKYRRRSGLPRFAAMLIGALSLASCDMLIGERWEWRQKLTVEVETPEGIRAGSAVTEVRWQEANSVGTYPGSYRGGATVVDLGGGRYLFALLGESTRYLAIRTFEDALGDDYSITERGFAATSRLRGTRDVPREHYPLLVTFGDIADPTSVRRVDPDDLAASFGPGVGLSRITLEMTDEPVTEGRVEQVLRWLGSIKGRLKPTNKRYADELTVEETLYSIDFKKE